TIINLQKRDIVPLIEDLIEAFKSLTDVKKINLSFSHEQPSFFLYYDEDKIEKVLSNLLSNAVKFTEANGYIEVRLKQAAMDDTSFALIEVVNSGKGIPENEREAIFKPFIQGSVSNEGTGLGLAYSRGLVDLHSGKIVVKSDLLIEGDHRGEYETTFSVSLPTRVLNREGLSKPDEINAHKSITELILSDNTPAKNVGDISPVKINGKTPVLLITEDNPELRQYLADHFKTSYTILQAGNGREGFDMAAENLPDLILSDVMMPEVDGLDFCKKVKTNPKTAHIPVILLTAKAPMEDQIEGLETGADDYIVKPFNLSFLTAKVRNAILSRKDLKERYRREISM
ncbi:MAG: response regulator, partial [Sphingobacteriales bacterium]